MKTTIDIPDELLRHTKATAALAGETLRDYVATAIRERLQREGAAPERSRGWRSVFGLATRGEVRVVDAVIADELEQVDPAEWT